MSSPGPIYKICRPAEYGAALKTGVFKGSPDDLRDGFIHFSTASQLTGTLAKHFNGESDLVLLKLDPLIFGPDLVWEESRGGEMFPHLYGELEMTSVLGQTPAIWDGDAHKIEKGFLDE